MNSKLIDNKRRGHADKILQKVRKKGGPEITADAAESEVETATKKKKSEAKRPDAALREQYSVIRSDIIRLRDDLSKGYEMAKSVIDKGFVKDLLRAK